MKKTNFPFFLSLGLALVFSGCGGGGGSGSSEEKPAAVQPERVAQPASAAATSRFLHYTVRTLGTLGTESWGVAVNEAGQVTGNYYDAAGQVNVFFWEGREMLPLVAAAQAADLNEAGQVIGWLERPQGPAAMLYDGGIITLDPASPFSRAYDINEAGQIAGHRRAQPESDQAFIEENGQLTFPASFPGYAARINDAGQTVLQQMRPNGMGAVLLAGGQLTELGSLGGPDLYVGDLNDHGTVVGWGTTAEGEYHAFLWRDGRLTDLAPLIGATFCSAVAVNNLDQVLIRATTVDGYRHYLWEEGRVTALATFGSPEASAVDLNDRGQITGWLQTAEGEIRAFLATPDAG